MVLVKEESNYRVDKSTAEVRSLHVLNQGKQ